MPRLSVEELKGAVATGAWSVESRELADVMVDKFALIRRVGRLMAEGEADRAEPGRAPKRRRRTSSEPSRPPRERQL